MPMPLYVTPFVGSTWNGDPVLWVPDSASGVCTRCTAHFTSLTRRHHCRRCGNLYCAACCGFFLAANDTCSSARQLVRVCAPCRSPVLSLPAAVIRYICTAFLSERGQCTMLRVCRRFSEAAPALPFVCLETPLALRYRAITTSKIHSRGPGLYSLMTPTEVHCGSSHSSLFSHGHTGSPLATSPKRANRYGTHTCSQTKEFVKASGVPALDGLGVSSATGELKLMTRVKKRHFFSRREWQQFHRELLLLQALSGHPIVFNLFEVAQTAGEVLVVRDYAPCMPLRVFCSNALSRRHAGSVSPCSASHHSSCSDASPCLRERLAATVGRQLLRAVQCVHTELHTALGGIDAGSLVVTAEGTVKLLDLSSRRRHCALPNPREREKPAGMSADERASESDEEVSFLSQGDSQSLSSSFALSSHGHGERECFAKRRRGAPPPLSIPTPDPALHNRSRLLARASAERRSQKATLTASFCMSHDSEATSMLQVARREDVRTVGKLCHELATGSCYDNARAAFAGWEQLSGPAAFAVSAMLPEEQDDDLTPPPSVLLQTYDFFGERHFQVCLPTLFP